METVSSSTAINSTVKSVVICSSFIATTQALRNSLQGSTTNYFTRPIGDLSRVLGAAEFRKTMPTVQLWWIDVPTQCTADFVNYRSYRTVVSVRRDYSGVRSQPSRLARGAQFRHALRPCNRTVHCTCQYGFEPHYRIDFYTRHVAVQNTPCKHANFPDSPATEAMLASMVEQWSTHHLSHLQLAPATCVEQSYVLEPSASLRDSGLRQRSDPKVSSGTTSLEMLHSSFRLRRALLGSGVN